VQRGTTLIITLVMLVLITLVGVSSIRSTTMDEKMAGNSRDRDKAFQAAESAVQTCLALLNAGTYPIAPLPAQATGTPYWDVATNWDVGAASSYEVNVTDTGLNAKPRCIVEAFGAAGSFRVTGRGVGGSAESVVMLQATYSTE
jgi:type IV pilus assembly protein PilX